MNTNRLEAFSDGVIAIIITVMVFKIEVPQSAGFDGLIEVGLGHHARSNNMISAFAVALIEALDSSDIAIASLVDESNSLTCTPP